MGIVKTRIPELVGSGTRGIMRAARLMGWLVPFSHTCSYTSSGRREINKGPFSHVTPRDRWGSQVKVMQPGHQVFSATVPSGWD